MLRPRHPTLYGQSMDGESGRTGANGGSSDLPRFVGARDFAESTGIPLRSLHRYLIRGLIPGAERVGPGTKWRIPLYASAFGKPATDRRIPGDTAI